MVIYSTHSGVCHSDFGVMMNSVCSSPILTPLNCITNYGLCYSLTLLQWSTLPAPTPKGQVGGHEGVGHIVKLGSGADESGVKIGDRVGVKWLSSICGSCGSPLFL